MAQKFKRSYRFAFRTALYICVFLTAIMAIFTILEIQNIWISLLIFAALCYFFSFLIIQYRVERFIYRRIKKVYDNVSLLDSKNPSS